MGRRKRMRSRNALYHVYSRGNRRHLVFQDEADYQTFETMMFEQAEKCQIRLKAWCQMPNHFHLLVETPEANLSQFMQRLLTGYARYVNRKYQLVGHVFQGRFGSSYCDRKKYFLKLISYIHLNPFRTKGGALCDRLEDWRWSSHLFYLGERKGPKWVKESIADVLREFFSPDPEEAVKRYRLCLERGRKKGETEEERAEYRKEFLGDDEFIQDVKARWEKEKARGENNLKPMSSLAELAEFTARFFNISVEDLLGSESHHKLSRIRHAFIYVARTGYRFRATGLARVLGRDVSTISQAVKRLAPGAGATEEVNSLQKALKTPRIPKMSNCQA